MVAVQSHQGSRAADRRCRLCQYRLAPRLKLHTWRAWRYSQRSDISSSGLIGRTVTRAKRILAHGAGAPMDSRFEQQMTGRTVSRGAAVWRFDFAYMAERRMNGRKRPPHRHPHCLGNGAPSGFTQKDHLGTAADAVAESQQSVFGQRETGRYIGCCGGAFVLWNGRDGHGECPLFSD